MRSASVGSVIEELVRIAPPNDAHPERRKGLLMGLSEYLSRSPGLSRKLDVLRDKPVIPMTDGTLEPLGSRTWVLGDRFDYCKAFKDTHTVNLADFEVMESISLRPLANAVRDHFEEEHLLSWLVDEEQVLGKNVEINVGCTDLVRNKVRYLRSILRDRRSGHELSLNMTFVQLDNLQIFHAPELVTKVALKGGNVGAAVQGHALAGPQVVYKGPPDGVRFFLNEKMFTVKVRQCLSAKFAAFCAVDHDAIKRLLDFVFVTDDTEVLTDELTKAGVSFRQDQHYNPQLLGQPVEVAVTSMERDIGDSSTAESPNASPVLDASTTASSRSTPLTDLGAFEPAATTSVNLVRTLLITPSVESPVKHVAAAPEPVKEPAAIKKAKEIGKNSRKGKYIPMDLGDITNTDLIRESPAHPDGSSSTPSPTKQLLPPRSRLSQLQQTGVATHSAAAVPQRPGARPLQFGSGPVPRTFDKVKSAAQELLELQTGLAGEKLTYAHLQAIFNNTLPISAWTSELRVDAGHPAWVPTDRDATYADFTIILDADEDDPLSTWLEQESVGILSRSRRRPRTYHIEVKATASASVYEPFHMSDNQMNLAEETKNDGDNVFLIFRWYNVDPEDREGSMPGLEVYGNPHVEEENGTLRMRASQWVLEKIYEDESESSEESEESDESDEYDEY